MDTVVMWRNEQVTVDEADGESDVWPVLAVVVEGESAGQDGALTQLLRLRRSANDAIADSH